jgi:tRNA-dihydrouridine synthase
VAAGVRVVTVHGRTRQQFYKGRADWAAIRAVREAIPDTPLVANGDVATADDARACLAASGADAVMIGRAALGRPWLPSQIVCELDAGRALPEPALGEKLGAMLAHYEGLLSAMGEGPGLRHARKHLAAALDDAAASGGAEAMALKPMILTAEEPDSVRAMLSRAFSLAPLPVAA